MMMRRSLNLKFLDLAALLYEVLIIIKLVYGYEHMAAALNGPPIGPSPLWFENPSPDASNQNAGKDNEAHKTPQALEALKQYLQQYGYLNANKEGTSPILKQMGDAIGLLQKSMGLPETKRLDAVTYLAVGEPRCGHADYMQSQRHSTPQKFASFNVIKASALLEDESKTIAISNHGDFHVTSEEVVAGGRISQEATKFAYFSGNPRWNSRFELTWALSPSMVTQRLSRDDIRLAFTHAFQLWAATIPTFHFIEVQDYNSANVKISFVAGEHGDTQNFDGVLGIIAHAFSPEDGRVHFDNAEFWSVDVKSDKAPLALDLTSVAIHEVGHVIGLAHSPVRKSVMFPSISPHHTKRTLSNDDVQGVHQLYGLANLVPAPNPHLAVDHANAMNSNWTILIPSVFLNLIFLMGEDVLLPRSR